MDEMIQRLSELYSKEKSIKNKILLENAISSLKEYHELTKNNPVQKKKFYWLNSVANPCAVPTCVIWVKNHAPKIAIKITIKIIIKTIGAIITVNAFPVERLK